jgi:hypothetical protein
MKRKTGFKVCFLTNATCTAYGSAIRTLREDYPLLLQKSLVPSIYREDIGLIDETGSFGHSAGHVIASSIGEYKRCHKWLRTVAVGLYKLNPVVAHSLNLLSSPLLCAPPQRPVSTLGAYKVRNWFQAFAFNRALCLDGAGILFSKSDVQVSRIWSPLGSSGVRTIKVRWSITARLRLVGNMTEEAHFDGISEYRLDRGGVIYQHTLTDLDWDVVGRYNLNPVDP